MQGRRGVEWARAAAALLPVALVTGMVGAAAPAFGAPQGAASPATARVIVTMPPGQVASGSTDDAIATPAAATATAATPGGGVHGAVASIATVTGDVPLVGGVVAQVTPAQQAQLQARGLVVTPDEDVHVAGTAGGPTGRAPAAVVPRTTGATALWAKGNDGTGVNVAVLDTGIDRLPDFGNRLVAGVDLSGEGNPFNDGYGHGTFVAGLIAGNGASSHGFYTGEAPGAGLVSVKVAGASGVTDLATVIDGIDWVVAHRVVYGIKVLNLSLGAAPLESTVLNPLDQAVEAAWQAGVVVVASAGNAGPFNGTILTPGDDPLVITVGALDDLGSATARPVMTTFSSVGPTSPDGWIKPDLVTSGRSVVSLRAPGSTVDVGNPQARIGTGNFVGSGTSFSAAITSGAAALVLAAHAGTPDDVKARLLGAAAPGPVGNPFVDGHGALDVALAAAQTSLRLSQPAPNAATAQGHTVPLSRTWRLSTWDPAAWAGSTWRGRPPAPGTVSWGPRLPGAPARGAGPQGSSWNGSSWNGSSWNGSSWNGSSWNGSSWNGSSWSGSSWSGSSWNGSSWNGSSWNGSSWNGSSWN
ncbi:MAG TPA: S8 family serine peptidase [Acidimicrobiales bacterium]|nr:S8 family serine peptidase [Acidimicrobiales bacterium]